MSTFHSDSPDLIRIEGSQITLVFTRLNATSGVLTWNIPPPAVGCSAGNRAYNGILITAKKSAELVVDKPLDGFKYQGDPTVDFDAHIGSKINENTIVVGAFYNDTTSTSLLINDLQSGVDYFFNSYAVDNVTHYHFDGNHSYSLPESTLLEGATQASQTVTFPEPIEESDATGLNGTHDFKFKINGVEYTYSIDGSNVTDFEELIDELNRQFALSVTPTPSTGSSAPNEGQFYFDGEKVKEWTQTGYIIHDAIVQDEQPNVIQVGDYWYNPSTKDVKVWDGSDWGSVVATITFPEDPTDIKCDYVWLSNVTGRVWSGNVWCEVPTYIQTTDPSLAPSLTCEQYWFDATTGEVKQWQSPACGAATSLWVVRNVIFAPYNPHTPTVGALWFDEDDSILYSWNGTSWDEESVLIQTAEPTPIANMYWYNASTRQLKRRNSGNTAWVSQFVTIYDTDFTVPSCSMWLNSTTNQLREWDELSSTWVVVNDFEIGIDPSSAPIIQEDALWVDPTSRLTKKWTGSMWVNCPTIDSIQDPRNPSDGTVWIDGEAFHERDSGSWILIEPISSITDPSTPAINQLWYDTDDEELRRWNGTSWVLIPSSTTSLAPNIDDYWYDTGTGTLYQWKGSEYVEKPGIANVSIMDGALEFTTSSTGSTASIYVMNPSPFLQFDPPGTVLNANIGSDAVTTKPMADQIGVGTDGTGALRKQLSDSVRMYLGAGVTDVELTPYQIDNAITNALQELRMKSSAGVRRDFFLLRGKYGQAVYTLSDKTTGLNTIVSIIKITRQRSGFYGGYDNQIFAQRFAQDMYRLSSASDLVTLEAYAQHIELVEKLFSVDMMFLFNERTRKLKLMQPLRANELFLLECAVERTEQELMQDRYIANWIQDYTRAECMEMLSMIRGKFSTLPGPNGGVTLNGSELWQNAQTIKEELRKELDNFEANTPDEWLGDIVMG